MPLYRMMYQYNGVPTVHNTYHELPNIRALAKFLNHFVKKNPKCRVIMCHISNAKYEIKEPVQFLPIEFEKQEWFTGYKQRLLEWYKYYHVDNPKKGKKKAKTKEKPSANSQKLDTIYVVIGSTKIPVEPHLSLDEIQEHASKIYPYIKNLKPVVKNNEIRFI